MFRFPIANVSQILRDTKLPVQTVIVTGWCLIFVKLENQVCGNLSDVLCLYSEFCRWCTISERKVVRGTVSKAVIGFVSSYILKIRKDEKAPKVCEDIFIKK